MESDATFQPDKLRKLHDSESKSQVSQQPVPPELAERGNICSDAHTIDAKDC